MPIHTHPCSSLGIPVIPVNVPIIPLPGTSRREGLKFGLPLINVAGNVGIVLDDEVTKDSKNLVTSGTLHSRFLEVEEMIETGETGIGKRLDALQAGLDDHVGKTDNPHAVTKGQVGLGNVDNTADADKPVSTAQAAAIRAVSDAVEAEAARAKAAEATKAYASTVTDLTTRVSAVESKKADKTSITTLSTTVDGLKSSKRGAYDLAVYRRVLYANLGVTLHDGSTGDVIGSNGFSTMCYLDYSSHGSESYRGQLGADLFLTVVIVTSGGEVTAPGYAVIEIDGESVTIGNLTLGNGNRNFSGSGFSVASEGDYEYELDGQILSQEEVGTMSDETLLTSSDGMALKADAVSAAVASAREKAKADRPFDVSDVAAGATLAHSTVSRFSPADASEVAFTLADPPSGKMAEYELWVDCTAAAPASLTFRLANAQIDPRVEGEVEAMQAGKAYAYRVRAFGNPDAAHVTVLISQSEAAPAGYTPDQLYAPDSAFEIDTTKGDGLTFSVQVMATSATGDGNYATVHWGDGTKTRQYVTSLKDFTHTYARAGNYVVRISNADRFYLAGSPMVVRALRWGDTVTTAPGTYSACPNLGGTVPPWGTAMYRFGSSSSRVDPVTPSASTNHGAFTYCSGLTGPIPPWPDRLPNATGSAIGTSSLACVYAGCSGLTGEIPPWPRWCAGVSMTYAGCSGLTGPIPAWPLYPLTTGDACIVLSTAYGTFWHCSGLTGPIPEWPAASSSSTVVNVSYPSSSTAGYDYLGMFAGCSGLTGKIPKWTGSTAGPSWQFRGVAGLYAGCTGLEGIWDEDAADAEVMPSSATKHTDCVKGASEAVRRHFTTAWGGTKDAPSA